MPYVNVRVAGKLSKEQKKQIAEGVTRVIVEATGKAATSTHVVIEEVPKDSWAKGGVLLSENA